MDCYENKFAEGGKIGRFFSARYTQRFGNKQIGGFRSSPSDYTRVEKERREGEGGIRRRGGSEPFPSTDPFFSSFAQPRIFQYSLHFPRDVTAYRYSISSGRNRATVATLHRSPLLRRTRREGKRERERKNKGTRWKMWRDRRLPLSPPLPAESLYELAPLTPPPPPRGEFIRPPKWRYLRPVVDWNRASCVPLSY